LDLGLTEEQERWRQAVIEFARTELQHDLLEQERSKAFPFDLWLKCAEFGIQGLPMPQQ
jgi:alkylation response protein AidB-like acyl-CoA dehydrogenase